MKKTIGRIILVLVLILIVAAAAAAYLQYDNLAAIKTGLTEDPETIQQNLEEVDDFYNSTMEEYEIPETEFTEEQLAQIASGDLSLEDAAAAVLGGSGNSVSAGSSGGTAGSAGTSASSSAQANSSPAPSNPSAPQNPTGGEAQPQQSEVQKKVAEIYVLKASYESQLAGVIDEVLKECESGSVSRAQAALNHMGQLSAMEKDCDRKMDALLTDIRTALEKEGKSTDLADQLAAAYRSEKESTKAYYMSKLN